MKQGLRRCESLHQRAHRVQQQPVHAGEPKAAGREHRARDRLLRAAPQAQRGHHGRLRRWRHLQEDPSLERPRVQVRCAGARPRQRPARSSPRMTCSATAAPAGVLLRRRPPASAPRKKFAPHDLLGNSCARWRAACPVALLLCAERGRSTGGMPHRALGVGAVREITTLPRRHRPPLRCASGREAARRAGAPWYTAAATPWRAWKAAEHAAQGGFSWRCSVCSERSKRLPATCGRRPAPCQGRAAPARAARAPSGCPGLLLNGTMASHACRPSISASGMRSTASASCHRPGPGDRLRPKLAPAPIRPRRYMRAPSGCHVRAPSGRAPAPWMRRSRA
jgi:hypothetical protein